MYKGNPIPAMHVQEIEFVQEETAVSVASVFPSMARRETKFVPRSGHNCKRERKRKSGAIVRNGVKDIRAAAQVAGYFASQRDLKRSCSRGRKDARNGGRNLAHYGAS